MKQTFSNSIPYKVPFLKGVKILYNLMRHTSKDSIPHQSSDIPVVSLTSRNLKTMEDYSVIRLAHSCLLFKLENKFILTDPVFSKRASPFTWVGPKRFHDMPIDIQSLPPIHAVIISHDHYDHLDKKSIKALYHKVDYFYTPLKVGKRLECFGVPSSKIIELAWNEQHKNNEFNFICTPAEHFSGRTLWDKNTTLWSSWVIQAPKAKLFFGADGGYFDGFKEIGWNYGPFDMSFLEAGAYNTLWEEIHMLPHQTIQAHKDLQAKSLFPIHNGSFNLSSHAWYEPFQRIAQLSKEHNIDVHFPKMGQSISLFKTSTDTHWWEKSYY